MTDSRPLQVLIRLAGEVAAAVRASNAAGNLPTVTDALVARITEFSSGGFTVYRREMEKELPSPAVLQRIVAESLRNHKAELEICAKDIAATRGVDLPTVRGDIEYFLLISAGSAIERSDEALQDDVRRFVRQATGGYIMWGGVVLLDGVRLMSHSNWPLGSGSVQQKDSGSMKRTRPMFLRYSTSR